MNEAGGKMEVKEEGRKKRSDWEINSGENNFIAKTCNTRSTTKYAGMSMGDEVEAVVMVGTKKILK